MAVYQVEEYYVFIEFENELSGDTKEAIKTTLSDAGYLNHELTDKTVLVESIDSVEEAESVESFLCF